MTPNQFTLIRPVWYQPESTISEWESVTLKQEGASRAVHELEYSGGGKTKIYRSLYLPTQAVWCWVKPGGHLQVKPPMVLTHKNWQLCCLVEHSSRSEKEEDIVQFKSWNPQIDKTTLKTVIAVKMPWLKLCEITACTTVRGRVKFQPFFSHWPTNELRLDQTQETQKEECVGDWGGGDD